ncbi:MAG: hypothetical protein HWN81_00435 [Candidatus Lokiarchaeota archaeon]|nr:hypothetical protein [Candidatus Lokiarchaeota archaeon]
MKDKFYYLDGSILDYYGWDKILHRLDGPAIEYANGSKEWWIEDKRHRLDGPAIEYSSGSKRWYVKGKRHRLDGPAIEYVEGSKSWYVEGKCHRLDGPAIEYANGDKEWYVEGKRLTEEQFEAHPKRQDYLASLAIEEILGEKR